MTTQLFLRTLASDLNTSGELALWPNRGPFSNTVVTNSAASGTDIQVTFTAGGTAIAFMSLPMQAVTVSGSVTVNVRGLTNSTLSNTCAGIKIEHCDTNGNVLGTMVADQNVTGVKYTTSDAAYNASFTPTSASLSNGDRIKVTVLVKNVGTMTSGHTATNSLDGPTSGLAGDSFVTFTETLTSIAPTTTFYLAAEGAASGAVSTDAMNVSQAIPAGAAVVVHTTSTAGAVTGVTDSAGGNTYTFRASVTATTNTYSYTSVLVNPLPVGGTITITRSGTSGQLVGVAWAEPRATGTIDTTASKTASGSSTSPSLATGTFATANESVFALIGNASAGGLPAWASGPGFNLAGTGNGWANMGQSGNVRQSASAVTQLGSTAAVTAAATITTTTWEVIVTCVEITPPAPPAAGPPVQQVTVLTAVSRAANW